MKAGLAVWPKSSISKSFGIFRDTVNKLQRLLIDRREKRLIEEPMTTVRLRSGY